MNPNAVQQPPMNPALQQALMQRVQSGGMPTPALNQTSAAAPMPMSQMPAAPGPQAPTSPMAPKSRSEEEVITNALIQRQRHLSNMQKQGSSQSLTSMPIS